MYSINDVVAKKEGGVFQIVDIVNIDLGLGEQQYLVLKPYFHPDKANIYVPLEKAEAFLRALISIKQAMDLIDKIPLIEEVWYQDPKQRKQEFEILIRSGDLTNYFVLLKSIYLHQKFLRENKKSLSTNDRFVLDRIKTSLFEELSLVLDKPIDDIEKSIEDKLEL